MIQLEHVTYRYPEIARPALKDVTLDIPRGALALVAGPSGVGKSTLLRCLNGLVPHFSGGHLSGRIRVNGLDPVQETPQVMSRHVGFVFQDPEAQFIVDQVEDELAFALENAAIPRAEMRARITDALEMLELQGFRRRRLASLSGGERQKVAIAAALILQPRVLVLDEPTSQLDPQSAEDILDALRRLNSALGLTIVLAEHRLERILPYADNLIYLPDQGPPLAGEPRLVLRQMPEAPPLITLARELGWSPLPLTLEEARPLGQEVLKQAVPLVDDPLPLPHPPGTPCLSARELTVSYGSHVAVSGVDLDLWPGEIAALVGRNGAGKTSLLKSLVSLVKLQQGQVWVGGQEVTGQDTADICRRVGYLPQNPNALLFADTVREELEITLRNHARGSDNGQLKGAIPPQALLDTLGLADKAETYPRDLSVGERQRAALGAIAITQPDVLLLDEPTRGLDYASKEALAGLLSRWRDEGMAILLVTHDVEWAASLADRAIQMQEGRIIAQGRPQEVLAVPPFAPQMARLFPGRGWLTVQAVLQALEDDPVTE